MLGHKVVQHFSRAGIDVWWTIRGASDHPSWAPVPELSSERTIPHVDATDTARTEELVGTMRPDFVINCVGVIKQRDQSLDESLCMRLNARLPHLLAQWLRPFGRLIQVSTDCVFRGDRGFYSERDAADAADLYGRSKALGEVRASNALVLRTSLIGRELQHHRSLVDWFLSQRGQSVKGFRRALWSGVTTIEFARVLERIVRSSLPMSGIYNLTSECISKYGLLQLLKKHYRLDIEIVPDDDFERNLCLDGSLFAHTLGYRCPPLDAQIRELAKDPTPYGPLPSPTK